MVKLKTCDCGGQAKILQYGFIKPLYLVQCESCGDSVMGRPGYSTRDEATAAWNRKKKQDERPERRGKR